MKFFECNECENIVTASDSIDPEIMSCPSCGYSDLELCVDTIEIEKKAYARGVEDAAKIVDIHSSIRMSDDTIYNWVSHMAKQIRQLVQVIGLKK